MLYYFGQLVVQLPSILITKILSIHVLLSANEIFEFKTAFFVVQNTLKNVLSTNLDLSYPLKALKPNSKKMG